MEHQLNHIDFCPVCKTEDHSKYIKAIDHNVSGDTFQIVKCNSCGFRFTNPIPTKETIGEYYKSDNYISHSSTKKGLINKVYHVIRKRAIRQKENLAASISKEKSILDIGCGTGDFLAYCQSQNWKVLGVEPDQDARKLAKEKNNIFALPISELYALPEGSVDTISMWHVLEHVYDLNSDIEVYKKLLKPGGHLIIAVPNCDSYDAEHYQSDWAAFDLPIHLYHFTEKDIKNLFENHGMKLIKTLPMKFDSYYISMISEKYKQGNILKGFWIGMRSNLKARQNNRGFSSQIYVIQK